MRLTKRGNIVVAGLLLSTGGVLGIALPGSSQVPYEELPDTQPAWTQEEALENCKVYTELGWPSEEESCRQAAYRTDW